MCMIISTDETRLCLKERISTNLAFRGSADDFFDYVNSLDESKIVIDFSGIESISRSFVHQYTINKLRSNKQITDINIPVNIKPMFELVKRQRSEKNASPHNLITPSHAL